MSEYTATIEWQRGDGEGYLDNKYSRGHEWQFDGGLRVPASSAPDIVPLPYSVEENVDPEEAFIASLSSCHMLFFLSYACKNKFVVDRYIDKATGIMGKNAEGKMAMTKVILNPQMTFAGEHQPNTKEIESMHHLAHEKCFIANSVKTKIEISM